MLIQEMHNLVNLKLQKLASNVYDWIKSEYVDDMLNNSINSYIKNRYNSFSLSGKPPFQRNLKQLSDLQNILRTEELDSFKINSRTFMMIFPGDLLFPVDFSANVSDECKYPTGFPVTTSLNLYSYSFNLPYNIEYISFGDENTVLVNFPGYTDPSENFLNFRILQGNMRNDFGDFYAKGMRITFVSKTNSTLTVKLKDVAEVLTYNGVPQAYNLHVNLGEDYQKIRVTASEEFVHNLNHPFADSISDAPMGYIENNKVYIDSSKKFILSKVRCSYIRKFTPVSLSLDMSCDLPEHTHNEIVDMTVAEILETIESPRTQSKQMFNQINE